MNQLHVCPSPVSTIDSICGMVSYILFSIFFFYDKFLPIFTTFLTLTALYKSMGKIFKFEIEIYTKFQSRKHIIFYILANFFFLSHQMSAKPGSDLEPCRMTKKAVALHLSMMGVRYIRLR